MVVAHDPERAKEQTERRREKLTALTEFGDALAAKLDAQDAGSNERGRRASDRGAYTRFSREVFDAHFSRFITPELESKRFAFSVNEEAVEKAEHLDGKLVLLTNVTDLEAEEHRRALQGAR